MMGVLNFAHASFYMLGAYIAYSIARFIGFWPGLIIAPLVVGVLGALFERLCLRRVHKFGHVPELLITFGLSFVIIELVHPDLGPHRRSSSCRPKRCAGRPSRSSIRRVDRPAAGLRRGAGGDVRGGRCRPSASSARRSRRRAAS